MSIEPINKRFPDATNEILEPLKSPSNDEDLETSDGGEDEQLQNQLIKSLKSLNLQPTFISDIKVG